MSPSALVSFNSLLWVAVLGFVGRSIVATPVIAALALVVGPSYLTSQDAGQYLAIGFGLVAVLAATYGEEILRYIESATPTGRDRVDRSPVKERQRLASIGAVRG